MIVHGTCTYQAALSWVEREHELPPQGYKKKEVQASHEIHVIYSVVVPCMYECMLNGPVGLAGSQRWQLTTACHVRHPALPQNS